MHPEVVDFQGQSQVQRGPVPQEPLAHGHAVSGGYHQSGGEGKSIVGL